MSTHRPLKLALAALLLASLASVAAGCSRQAQGQRCDHKNGDDDCDTAAGLVCTPGGQLGSQSDICCPPTGATDPACIPGALGAGGSGSTTSSSTTTTTTSSTSTSTTGTGGAGTGGSATGGSGGAGTGGAAAGGAATTTKDAGK